MTDAGDDAIRKSVTLPRWLWEKVKEIRFRDRLDTQSEAIRKIIENGVRMDEQTVDNTKSKDH